MVKPQNQSKKIHPSRYAYAADALRKDILKGQLAAGQKMPSERKLCETFDTSRVTIRRALRILEEERLIIRRHGSGTYVASRPERRIPLMIDYTGSMRDHAPSLTRRLLCHHMQSAEAEHAEALRIEVQAPILYAERIDSLKKQPVAWDQVFIPKEFAINLKRSHLSRTDFVEAWTQSCDFRIDSLQQTIEATAANTETARHLNVSKGKAILRTRERYHAEDGRVAGLFISYYHPHYICIDAHHRWASIQTQRTS